MYTQSHVKTIMEADVYQSVRVDMCLSGNSCVALQSNGFVAKFSRKRLKKVVFLLKCELLVLTWRKQQWKIFIVESFYGCPACFCLLFF